MRGALAAGVLGALALAAAFAPTADASHGSLALPDLHPNERVGMALDWYATDEEGCVYHPQFQGDCPKAGMKWMAVTLASAGVDPSTWPAEDGSVESWLLENADELREEACGSIDATGSCRADAVHSRAKSILAFSATGLDPRSVPLPDGGQRDLVEELFSWFDAEAGQFGGRGYVNDDVWALVSLNTLDYADDRTKAAADFVASDQTPDGGIGWDAEGPARPDMTGAALMALAPRGYPEVVDDALGYLADRQAQQGEGRACWSSGDPDVGHTAWVIQGLVAAGEDPRDWSVGDRSPMECLAGLQGDQGGYRTSYEAGDSGSYQATHQALAALSWVPYGQLTATNLEASWHRHTHVDETITIAEAPSATVYVDGSPEASVDVTPQEAGEQYFHGVDSEPYPRPLNVTVTVDPKPDDGEEGQGSGDGTGDDGDSDGGEGEAVDGESEDSQDNGGASDSSDSDTGGASGSDPGPTEEPEPPTVVRWDLDVAERSVVQRVQVHADPGDAPVAAYRVDWGDGNTTDWRANATFEHTYTNLGTVTVTAWARDADGHVSDAAEAELEVVDATPRIDVDGPATVYRGEPASFSATAGDPDGPAPVIEWTAAGRNATGENATFRFDEPGVRTVDARAVDAAGNVAEASHRLVVENRAPENVTVEPTVVSANQTTLLVADAIDPEGDELDIRWTGDAGLFPGPRFAYEAPAPGNDTLVLTVVDEHGDWTRANVSLRIVPNDASKETNSPSDASNEDPGSGSNASLPEGPPTPPNVPEPEHGWPDDPASGSGTPSCQSTSTGPRTPPSRSTLAPGDGLSPTNATSASTGDRGQAPSTGCQASTVPIDGLDASPWDRDGQTETGSPRGSNASQTARSVPALEAAVVVSVATLAGLSLPRRFR